MKNKIGIILTIFMGCSLALLGAAASETLDISKISRPERLYNLGVELYGDGNYQMAEECFTRAASATTDLGLKHKSLYNLGNTHFKLGSYANSVQAYESALLGGPDPRAAYNLEVAKKKLAQENESKGDSQEGQDGSEGEDGSEGSENQDGQGNQDDQDGQQNQKGQKNKKSSQQNNENGQDQESDEADQSDEAEKNNEGHENGDEGDESDEDSQDKKGDQQDNEKDKSSENAENSQSNDGTDQDTELPQEDSLTNSKGLKEEQRGDVQMGQEDAQPEAEVSQKARAMKNIKANPYMIEKILREMERREAELQGRARNEAVPQRREEMDPFNMSAEELRDWMENRRRPQSRQSDTPDW